MINNHNKRRQAKEQSSPDNEVYLKIKNAPEGKQQIIMVDRDKKKSKDAGLEQQYSNFLT